MNNKLVILSIAALSIVACKKEAPKQDGPKPYPVVKVEEKNIVGYQTFPATIQGRVNNDVRAKIQGYITQVLVDEGQYVTKGQPLFRLETNILTENAAASKAGIGAAESNIAAAQAAVNAANVEVNKLKPLVQKNIISNVQLQTAQANLAQAQAQLQQARAGKSQAVANYKGVAANIEYSIIRAPISGVIGKLPLKVGSLVGPTDQTPLTTISDTSEIFAYFSMNEKEYFDFLEKSPGASMPEKIKNLPMVELQLANGSLYPEKGRIEAITGQIDPTTGTIQFRVGFPNAQKLLSNGNSGTIRFPEQYNNVLVVPESATYEQQGIVYVYKVDKDTAKNVVVNIIDRIDNLALIKSGINKGETVVAAGIGGLKTGTAVKPKPINMDSLVQSIKPKF
ncbi:secretion protein HlyD [Chryseobacterium sp. IHB B 17019]|jgi:membrane fusion protein (multidrug efflux system)|uniref:efflux RND transporter periplasmic adaptor subunit n=1 Tax=Chryseobacterium sp. IHB B 17019 TaxID=1721091 RepID=UPI00072285EF|nr:efflux RND transporter periplasmic adaptor subunit [Chryseobacterium sp. IHB B 17019]ALR30280.1 secretion protein HlyD [Chryseobacterium sp. IHB B 17019]